MTIKEATLSVDVDVVVRKIIIEAVLWHRFFHAVRKNPPDGGFLRWWNKDVPKNYFTASFSAFAARNFGTRISGTSIDSPVRGLRP